MRNSFELIEKASRPSSAGQTQQADGGQPDVDLSDLTDAQLTRELKRRRERATASASGERDGRGSAHQSAESGVAKHEQAEAETEALADWAVRAHKRGDDAPAMTFHRERQAELAKCRGDLWDVMVSIAKTQTGRDDEMLALGEALGSSPLVKQLYTTYDALGD